MKGRYTLTICKVKEQASMGFRARCKGLQLRFNWKLMQSWKPQQRIRLSCWKTRAITARLCDSNI
jgi:hypothetical protein